MALVVAGVAVAALMHQLVPRLALLTAAVLVGLAVGNLAALRSGVPAACQTGTTFAARRLLRVGVVLLGLRLALGDLADLGVPALATILGIVVVTILGIRWLAAALGLSRATGLLLAAGYAICGASAVAAVSASTAHEEEDVANAIAMVTLCGSLAIVVLPLLGGQLGLSPAEFGAWVGASVHDVGQVVAAASTAGPVALDEAVVVKLTRVALLAPLVAVVALTEARRSGRGRSGGQDEAGRRPPVVPFFLVAFLMAVVLRSTGWLPEPALEIAELAQTLLLAAALFALGLGVRLDRLVRTGGAAMALGLVAWVLVAGVALGAVQLGWLG